MPSLDLEVRTQLDRTLANAAAAEAIRIFSRTGDEIGGSLGSKITRALGALDFNPAKTALRELQAEYAKLAAAADAAESLAVRRASEVEVALRRKVALQASGTASTLEMARAERAVTDARRASEQAMRRQESAIVASEAAHQRLGSAAVAAGESAGVAARAFNLLGAGAVVATGTAMVETTKHAADFQEQLIKLRASAGESAENLKVVHDGILQMAGSVGYSTSQLSDAMYTIEKAGFRGAEGLKVLQAAAQGAGAEQADLKEVVDGLTTSMTDFHVQPEQAARLMSQMVTAVGSAKTNFQDFAGALHSVEPVAAAAHLRLEDVWGSLAQITQSGTSAEQATENMRNAINAFTGQSQPARDAMAQFGINADEVSQKLSQRGLAGTMQYLYNTISQKVIPGSNLLDQGELLKNAQAVGDLDAMMTQMSPHAQELATAFKNNEIGVKAFTKEARAMGGEDAAKLLQFEQLNLKVDGFSKATRTGRDNLETLAAAMRAVTGTVAGQSVALQLAGENTDRVNGTIKAIASTYTDANGNVKGFSESQEGLNAKMRDVKAAFGAAAVEIGETFVPLMTTIANDAKWVADEFAKHPGVMHTVVTALEGLGGAWLTFKGIGIAETILGPITRGLATMAEAEGVAATAAGGLKTALGALGPIGIGAAAGMAAAGPVEHGLDHNSWLNDNFRNPIRRFFGMGDAHTGDMDGKSMWSGGYAGGGPMRAPGPKGRDSALFWGADGEHVIPANEVDAAGGHAGIYALRSILRRAGGGAVGPDVQIAESMSGTGYSQGSRNDCSGMVGRVIQGALGVGGGLPTTKNMGSWLAALGFQNGIGGPGTISVGWYDHGPNPNDGHAAMTLSDGENAESGGSHGNFLVGAGAAGASNPEFDHHMFLPNLYGEGMAGGMPGGFAGGMGGGAGGFGGIGGGAGGAMGGYFTPNPGKVSRAQEQLTHLDAEIKDAEERKSELKGNAKQSERDRLDEEIRHLNEERGQAQQRLVEAQRGDFHAGRGGRGGAMNGMPSLADDFGISGGLPGMAKWLVGWVGDMALSAAAGAGMFGDMGGGMPGLGGGPGGFSPVPGAEGLTSPLPGGGTGVSSPSTAAAVTPTAPSAPGGTPSSAAAGARSGRPNMFGDGFWRGPDASAPASPSAPGGMGPLMPSWAHPAATPDQLYPGRANSATPPNLGSMLSPGYTGGAPNFIPYFGDPIATSGTDTVPALLTPHEAVLPVDQAQAWRNAQHFAGGTPDVVDTASATPAPPKPPAPAPQMAPVPGGGESPTGPGKQNDQNDLMSQVFNSSRASQGMGISGGAGEAAASMFPGGGQAFQLAGRTVGYASQLAGIGVEGAIQSLLPNDSPLANFSGTLPGKLLGAVAGARPAGQNTAGAQTPQLTKDQVDKQTAKMGGGGQGNAPLVGEMHNYGVNSGEDVAAALSRQTYNSYSAGGPR